MWQLAVAQAGLSLFQGYQEKKQLENQAQVSELNSKNAQIDADFKSARLKQALSKQLALQNVLSGQQNRAGATVENWRQQSEINLMNDMSMLNINASQLRTAHKVRALGFKQQSKMSMINAGIGAGMGLMQYAQQRKKIGSKKDLPDSTTSINEQE